MPDRRSFLTHSAAIAAGALTLPTSSLATTRSDRELAADIQQKLATVLEDAPLAAKLSPVLLDVGFDWTAPARPASSFQTIVAYSFGNRPAATGATHPEPGPVNALLAEAVAAAWRQNHATIFAQWEIASFLKQQHTLGTVIAIEPVVAPDGSVTYLSTDGVAQAVVAHAGGDATKLGQVCVIAHRDHAKRCVETSRARRMNAYVSDTVTLPVTYDPQSGQPWTRRRDLYLVHDMAAQLMQIRAQRIAEAFPQG